MSEVLYISKCLRLIEEKVNLGKSQRWTYEDYKILQKLIYEASSINLSTHTLERLYGKLKIHKNYRPQTETKKALAIFLGYSDWEAFKRQNHPQPIAERWEPLLDEKRIASLTSESTITELTVTESSDTEPSVLKQNRISKRTRNIIAASLALIGMICLAIVLAPARKSATVGRVNFRAINRYGAVPHTVKFEHDLSGLEGDYFSIVIPAFQDTIKLSMTDKASYWTFSLPGRYTAYLMNGRNAIAETVVFIETTGWRVAETVDPNFEGGKWFLPQTALGSKGRLYTPSVFVGENIKKSDYYFLSYLNFQKFNIDGDHAVFETRFRNNSKERQAPCNDMWFKLIGIEGMLKMHFLTTGCTGFIDMTFGEKNLKGSKHDLSQFGIDMQSWKKAQLKIINKTVHVYLDGALIFKIQYSKSVGAIVGIEIISRTSGETDYVKLYNGNNKLVYEDDFGGKATN
jgi:hypothetical protein